LINRVAIKFSPNHSKIGFSNLPKNQFPSKTYKDLLFY